MTQIRINTDCHAPCCPCEIVPVIPHGKLGQGSANNDKEYRDWLRRQSHLVQVDYEYPGVAGTFGWSVTDVQKCRKCRKCGAEINPDEDDLDDEPVKCDACGRKKGNVFCRHSRTDGTVDCPECGVKAGDFIASAYDFLRDNDGLTAEDPGYFTSN